ncbi:hypothetical protein [Vibrio sp.]|uniref:hypothetical protein n=1 Tax=Vibrio sp. TaxID=678 RepID=UPI003D0E6426
MIQGAKQPSIRFHKAGPFGFQGVSFLPKVITFSKQGIAGTENEDFLSLPAGTFITQAFIQVDTTVNNSGVVTLGVDGDPDALITSTDFDASAAGNSATNIGSTVAAGANGLFLPDGDKIRLATTGTATEGAVSGFLAYFELVAMKDEGIHFEM